MVKKNFDVYGPGNPTPTPLEFSTSTLYPDILFINFSLMASILVQIKGADSTKFTASLVGTLGTMTSERWAQAIFDFEKKTITFSDRELFFANVACESCLDPLDGLQANPDGTTYYLERQKGPEVVKGRALSVDLGAHEIPMILEDRNGYLPLATFSDLFLNTYGIRFLYNGVIVFLLTGDFTATAEDLYYAAPTGQRSDSLAEFTYHELCLNGDYVYALKAKHDITSFDEFFTRTNRKEDLLSRDPVKAAKALAYVTYYDLDDNHSSMSNASYLAGKSTVVSGREFHGISQRAWDENYDLFSAARKEKLGMVLPYQEIGDTAFISFDTFLSHTKNYYESFPTLEDAGNDTFALVEYAHHEITKEGSTIKNVVIDLSCNSGGAASAAGYIASLFLDGATLYLKNPLDGATLSVPVKADVNLDGRFDSSDSVADKRLFCLTSPISFSCGNLVPSLFKNGTSHKVTLIGQKSGGGACMVDSTSTADGSVFAFSGNAVMCEVKNGVYYDIDQGVEPDVTLTRVESFYDRPALVQYLNTLL